MRRTLHCGRLRRDGGAALEIELDRECAYAIICKRMTGMSTPVDASALIYLAKSGGLSAASACFGVLLIPPAVWNEVIVAGLQRGSTDVAGIRAALDAGLVRATSLDAPLRRRALKIASQFGLGAGESEVLALGVTHELVLLDEHRATRAGKALGVTAIETLLVPALCVQAGVLNAPAAVDLLHAIARHTTVRAEMVRRVEQLIEEASR